MISKTIGSLGTLFSDKPTKWPELLNWIQTKYDKAVWRLKISLNWPWHHMTSSHTKPDWCLPQHRLSAGLLFADLQLQLLLEEICHNSVTVHADSMQINLLGHKLTENGFVPVAEWSFEWWNAQMTWHRGNNRKRSVHNSRPVRSRRWKKSRTSWEARSKGQSKAMWSRSHLVALVSARNHSKSSKMQRERQTQAGTRFDHGCLVMWLLPQQALQSLAIRRSHGVFPSGCQVFTLLVSTTNPQTRCLAVLLQWPSPISPDCLKYQQNHTMEGHRDTAFLTPKLFGFVTYPSKYPVNIPVLLIIVPSFFPGIR